MLAIAPVTYVRLKAVLRVSGKRTLAQLNAYDFTDAISSTLATVLSSTAWVDGALALALLAVMQFVVAMTSVRSSRGRRLLTFDRADGDGFSLALALLAVPGSENDFERIWGRPPRRSALGWAKHAGGTR